MLRLFRIDIGKEHEYEVCHAKANVREQGFPNKTETNKEILIYDDKPHLANIWAIFSVWPLQHNKGNCNFLQSRLKATKLAPKMQ